MNGLHRTATVFVAILTFSLPSPTSGQVEPDSLLLRYKAQPEALKYLVEIVADTSKYQRTGYGGRPVSTRALLEEMELKVEEGEVGELSGRYDFGLVKTWVVSGTQVMTRKWYRDTTFRMTERGEVGEMGGRFKASSGDEIFRRLWEIPHLLPEGPAGLGTTWAANRTLAMEETHSTEIETQYRVAKIEDGVVHVEFSGTVIEVFKGSGGRSGIQGTMSGEFTFRQSLGAMVRVEWNYDFRSGDWDVPWEYTEVSEHGAIVLVESTVGLPM